MLARSTVGAMASKADAAISNVLLKGSQGMQTAPRTEPGLVAAVTLGGIGDIATAWEPLLAKAGFTLGLRAVFCHGAPQVDFRGHPGGPCELADLLVVVDFTQPTRRLRRAVLIQVKMAAKIQRVKLNGPSSRRQLQLYQNWPRLSFIDTNSYGTRAFDLRTHQPGKSGTFGIIDRHTRKRATKPPIWTQHEASPTPSVISNEPTLGAFLAEMVDGTQPRFGRPASLPPSDDWSEVVDLLLRVTYAQAFHHKPTLGVAAPPRGVTAFAMLSNSRFGAKGGGVWQPPFDGFGYRFDDEPRGISVLHVHLERAAS